MQKVSAEPSTVDTSEMCAESCTVAISPNLNVKLYVELCVELCVDCGGEWQSQSISTTYGGMVSDFTE